MDLRVTGYAPDNPAAFATRPGAVVGPLALEALGPTGRPDWGVDELIALRRQLAVIRGLLDEREREAAAEECAIGANGADQPDRGRGNAA